MNAAYIQKCGYGRHFDELNPDNLKAFLYDLPYFTEQLSSYKQEGNTMLFKKLEVFIEAL